MSIKDRLNSDLREAMRRGDERRKSAFRLALAALRNAEIQAGHPLDDEGATSVLAREVKQRRDSIEAFRQGDRQDLVDREEAEMAALTPYLPQQLSRQEIVDAAREVMAEIDIPPGTGPKAKGKVMPVLMGRLRGRADGREVSAVVTELLSSEDS